MSKNYDYIKCGVCGWSWENHDQNPNCGLIKTADAIDAEFARASKVNMPREEEASALENNEPDSQDLNKVQDKPKPSSHPDCHQMSIWSHKSIFANSKYLHDSIKMISDRADFGLKKYGEPLRPFNGRDPLIDLAQEIVDGLAYCHQCIYEYGWNDEREDYDSSLYENFLQIRMNLNASLIMISRIVAETKGKK